MNAIWSGYDRSAANFLAHNLPAAVLTIVPVYELRGATVGAVTFLPPLFIEIIGGLLTHFAVKAMTRGQNAGEIEETTSIDNGV